VQFGHVTIDFIPCIKANFGELVVQGTEQSAEIVRNEPEHERTARAVHRLYSNLA